ncbi:MAG TPA: diaminopimelate decarboxylase, partial [Synergistales bacterium]|nr:diaminopimelate decarboxylase [Synergistales bacterium]
MPQESHFCFHGWDTVELARTYGTPLYVLSEETIRDRCREIRERFLNRYPHTRALYASKALNNLAVCRLIDQEGLGLDVVSGGELYTAHRSGFPMGKVYFHGNNKTPDEIRMALDLGVGTIVVDSMQELSSLAAISQNRRDPVGILLRLSPGVDVNTHKYISTGHMGSKFGFPLHGQDLGRPLTFHLIILTWI